MDLNQLIEFVTKLGFPVSLVLALLFGIYKVTTWCGIRFDQWVKPLLEKHFNLVDSLNESTKTNTQTLKDHAQLLVDVQRNSLEYQKTISQRLVDIFNELKEHRDKTENGTTRNSANSNLHNSG